MRPEAGIATVRRKAALLAAASIVLAALALEGHARGYPLGMTLLAAATLQAGICTAMFRSRVLQAMLAASLLLLLMHALVISQLLRQEAPPAAALLGDFCCAVLGGASLTFTPIETIALIVREAYFRARRQQHPPG